MAMSNTTVESTGVTGMTGAAGTQGGAGRSGKPGLLAIVPVMVAFFVMGFVDLSGTAINYVKDEFALSNGTANLLTVMVFFWFLLFSVPTGMLMNRIGRRRTVLWSILVTLVAMALPVVGYVACSGTVRLVLIVASFAFLGIGNTLMQVSLNPLLTVFVQGDGLASTLTMGQFVKCFAALFAPYIAIWGASTLGCWWIVFAIYLAVGVVGYVLLALDRIDEPAPDAGATSIGACFRLLFSDRIVLLCFLGIVAHVGIDVGVNAQAPRVLTEHTGDRFAAIATSAAMVFFIARMIGCFTGGIVLQRISNRAGLLACGTIMTVGVAGLAVFATIGVNPPVWLFWATVAMIGFGNANVFSLFLSHALMYRPDRQNEISGLMLMGLVGGGVFPPIMGVVADVMHAQIGAVIVMAVGCLYVLFLGIGHRVLESA